MSSMMPVFCRNFSCLPEMQPSVPMRERGGIGAAQFAAQLAAARAPGLVTIPATIGFGNAPGPGHCNRRGFCDRDHEPAFILKDGTSIAGGWKGRGPLKLT